MFYTSRNKGFTLTEVLMAAGILSVGFVLIAGAFPVGAKLTAIATERTIGAVACDEAIAKMRLHTIDFTLWDNNNWDPSIDLQFTNGVSFDYTKISTLPGLATIPGILAADIPFILDPGYLGFIPPVDEDYYYPSTNLVAEKKYHWSALWRYLGAGKVQATVFVSRFGDGGLKYPYPDPLNPGDWLTIDVPRPILIPGLTFVSPDRLRIDVKYKTYFIEGSKIVDDATGDIYVVDERDYSPTLNEIVLSEDWQGGDPADVWVLPASVLGSSITGTDPPVLKGRWPCVFLLPTTITF